MFFLQLFIQVYGALGIYAFSYSRHHFLVFQTIRPINIQSITSSVCLDLFFFSDLDPSVGGDTVMKGVNPIYEVGNFIFTHNSLDNFVAVYMENLTNEVCFGGDELGFFVGEIQGMQKSRNSGSGISDAPLLFDEFNYHNSIQN
jgi:hypothetical protein